MAYQVLARKWRPQNFTQIVGQEHVAQSLINALQHQRLHHAYLFTGTRGVGKTTIARILAKAINCENLQNSNPCGQCAVCTDFDNGRFMDLIEVDAASRTKVEDTRDLLDNAQYAPNQGRYKVYLIDEVHMLSGHSFNALLKTLEEPPEHVKFLLATTDPQKIPITVLSRCLQFNLKRLLPEQIEKQMEFILNQEQIEFDAQALTLLSRAADGSMRDGLSLLDQAIAYGQGRVNQVDVNAMLGTVAQQPVDDLLRALAATDGKAVLNIIAEIANLSVDFNGVLQQLLRVLHRIALFQNIPELKQQEFDPQMLEELATLMLPEDVQLYYQMGLIGQKDLDLAPDPRTGFEMLMLRMLAFRPVNQKANTVIVPSKAVNQSSTAAVETFQKQESNLETSIKSPEVEKNIQPEKVTTPTPQAPVSSDSSWSQIIQAMKLTGLTRELANNCVLDSIDETTCTLLISPSFTLSGSKTKEKLQTALETYFKRPLKVQFKSQNTQIQTPAAEYKQAQELKQQQAEQAINADENISALKEHFDARIIQGTISPNSNTK